MVRTLFATTFLLLLVSCSDRAASPLDAGVDAGGSDGPATPDVGTDAPGDAATTDTASDTPALDAPSDEGGPDALLDQGPGPDADASSTCPSDIQEEGACTTEGQSCGGPCTDACSFCNLFNCQGGRWQRLEVFPAPCFECGPDRRCQNDVQYCQRVGSDVGGEPDSYSCIATPPSCDGTATCQCLTDENVFFSDCEDANPGEVTIIVPGG